MSFGNFMAELQFTLFHLLEKSFMISISEMTGETLTKGNQERKEEREREEREERGEREKREERE